MAQLIIPCPTRLFKTINCLLKLTNVVRKSRINEPRRLCHENFLSEGTLEKGVVDVKLAEVLSLGDDKRKNKPESGRFDNRSKCFKVVNP